MENGKLKPEHRTPEQQQIAQVLANKFKIDASRILFFNSDEPWIPPVEIEAIARQFGGYSEISNLFDQYIAETKQFAYKAVVIDAEGRSYQRSGLATLGEHPTISAIDLAAGRALGAALRAAGFDPTRSGSVVVDLNEARENLTIKRDVTETTSKLLTEDEAKLRVADLRAIHGIAEEKELIRGKDDSQYREWLSDNYGVKSCVSLDAMMRKAVINRLNLYPFDDALTDDEVELAMVA